MKSSATHSADLKATPKKRFPRIGGALFMTAVSAITIYPALMGNVAAIPSGLIALICLLPMAFYFGEQSTMREINSLENRIRELEEKNLDKMANS
jgi:hypothetical protein